MCNVRRGIAPGFGSDQLVGQSPEPARPEFEAAGHLACHATPAPAGQSPTRRKVSLTRPFHPQRMQVQKRTMSWMPPASLYDEAQQKRAKQKATHEEFLSSQSSLADAITSIQ